MAAGYRSLLGFWIGGASAPPQQAGYRSLLAFWMGGACPGPEVSPPVTPPSSGGGGLGGGRMPRRFAVNPRARLDDEELMVILMAALHVIDPPL